MHELVNTSLPNGLIAGTHGFATVAMTRGLPDSLRVRLEALCAYSHRTSAHDESYYRQNPVNWFHVELAQGEHVVGRVAPSDFDYTGRTNRLARLRVFDAGEMPAAGGAEILAQGKGWFAMPWQGEPRYLDDGGDTCRRLGGLASPQADSAPAWEAWFGSGGTRHARRIAWQLERNLATGGKAIYFKTSAEWDVSGERLLALFADVINMLPQGLRPFATFSTFPTSLPAGAKCLLRGVYDRDRVFDASSAMQAWVDCESGRVEHEELLPADAGGSGGGRGGGPVSRGLGRFVAGETPAGFAGGGKGPLDVRSQPSWRSELDGAGGAKSMVKWLAAVFALVAVLGIGGIAGYVYLEKRKPQNREAFAAKEAESRIRDLGESEREAESGRYREELEKSERARIESERREAAGREEARAKAEREAEAARREKAQREKEARIASESAERNARRDEELRRHRQVAYLDAVEFRRGCPSYDYDSITQRCKDPFAIEDGCRVYYYAGNAVTNEPAGFKVNRSIRSQASLRWGENLEKKVDSLPLARRGFVLWYNPKCKRVYLDLNRRAQVGEQGERWFANSSEVDLSRHYFGDDPNFERVWAKYMGGKTVYLIDWKCSETCRSVKPLRMEGPKIPAEMMIAAMQKKVVGDYEERISFETNRQVKLRREIEGRLTPELQRLQSESNAIWTVWQAYRKRVSEREQLNSRIKEIDKQIKKSNADMVQKFVAKKREKESMVKAINALLPQMLAEGRARPTGEAIKGLRAYSSIGDLEQKLKGKCDAIDAKSRDISARRSAIANSVEQVELLGKARREFLDKFKDNIGNVLFTVHVEGEKIRE